MYPRDLPLAKRLLYRTGDPFLFVGARRIPPAAWPAIQMNGAHPQPRISIVTPSFNQAAFLERTIASVVSQRYGSLEYVVQDGASTDGSVDILTRRAQDLTSWESRPDTGQSEAINAGFSRTTGEIMAYLNSDDLLMPGALAAVSNFMTAHPGVDVVYSHGLMMDESDRPVVLLLLPEHSERALRLYDYIPQMTIFWRRAIWDRVGGRMDESLHYAMDWDLLLRFAGAGARFARLPTILGGFRLHGSQKTRTIRAKGSLEVDALRRRHARRALSFAEVVLRSSPHLLRRACFVTAYRLGLRQVDVPWARVSG